VETRPAAALNNVEMITALLSCNRQLRYWLVLNFSKVGTISLRILDTKPLFSFTNLH
jgi:hypothetical protein